MRPLIWIDLIEDNPGDANLIRIIMEDYPRSEVQVHHYADGETYLQVRHAAIPTAAMKRIVLLDYNLPGLSGAEVLKRLRAIYDEASLPVFVMSGRAFFGEVEVASLSEASGVIAKPMDMLDWWHILDEDILRPLGLIPPGGKGDMEPGLGQGGGCP